MGSSSLQLEAFPLHPVMASGSVSTEYVLLRVAAPKPAKGSALRLSTVLLLDVSGSMEGPPLRQVKESVARLLALLGSEDVLGIVAFADDAAKIAPLVRLQGDGCRRALGQSCETLRARSKTNISAGLERAVRLFPPRQSAATEPSSTAAASSMTAG